MQRPPTYLSNKKRVPVAQFVILGIMIALLLFGVVLLGLWLTGEDSPTKTLFATETPTPTLTFTPTLTSTPSQTPSETVSPTITTTPTPDKVFEYIIQDGDTVFGLKEKFGLRDDFLCTIAILNPAVNLDAITIGQKLVIPPPGLPCPTPTPIDFSQFARAQKVEYVVQAGDTISSIASKFNTTQEDILNENELEATDTIFVGQVLEIRVNMVTPTNTLAPTTTPGPTETPTPILFLTPATATLTPTP